MNIILYTTHCPKCLVLEKKLEQKNIDFIRNENITEMESLGFTSMPILSVDGQNKTFKEACDWLNSI